VHLADGKGGLGVGRGASAGYPEGSGVNAAAYAARAS
jgi:hypothetical protein